MGLADHIVTLCRLHSRYSSHGDIRRALNDTAGRLEADPDGGVSPDNDDCKRLIEAALKGIK